MKTFKGYGFFVLMLLVLALVFIANEYFINSNRDNYSVTPPRFSCLFFPSVGTTTMRQPWLTLSWVLGN